MGRQPGADRQVALGTAVVKNTIGPWLRSGRNSVYDNLFTSVPLAEELLVEQTTIVGMIHRHKVEIPKEMLPSNTRPESHPC